MKLESATDASMAMSGTKPDTLRSWRMIMALVLSTVFWLLVWYGDTVQSMVATWQANNTYTQCFLIAPISAWMIWQRRHAVAELELRPDFRALAALALVGFGWLFGQLAAVDAFQPFGVVLMIPLVVWAILGYPAVQALAFPLFFLFLAIPFGDFLISPMMEYTADFTVTALKLTGIPVYRDEQSFMIPSGSWSVVEACAGLRYLIASLTVGVLYAYLMYRSFTRRALFVTLSVIVPIVANWLRAYMIVMIGHLSENKYATGFDHLIAGWLFFGFVMLILFWIGSYFREDLEISPAPPETASYATPTRFSLTAITVATIAVAGVVAVWPAAAERLGNIGPQMQPALLAPLPAENWQTVAGGLAYWAPYFRNSSARIHEHYGRESTRASIYIAYYRNQRPGAELITSGNTLVSGNDRNWSDTSQTKRTIILDRGDLSFIEAKLRSASTNLLVWRWYWVDGQYIVNPYRGKFLQAKSRLLGNGDDAAAVIVYASYDGSPQDAEQALSDFVDTMLPAVTQSLERARDAMPSS
jgi:exosortase A